MHRTKCIAPNTIRNHAVTYNAAHLAVILNVQFSAFSFNLSCQKANFSQVNFLMNNNNNGWVISVDNRRYRPRQAKYFTRLRLVQYFSRLGRYRLLSTSNHPILYNLCAQNDHGN